MDGLQLLYASKREDIKNRLHEFKQLWQDADDKKVFAELAFCLCTPQSKATAADLAMRRATEDGVLYSGGHEEIAKHLTRSGVRFANNKAKYIHEARGYFSQNGALKIKSKLNLDDLPGLRTWLCENIKGFGMKEASHFLRNIGFGDDLAILDRHILKNLKKYGVISEIPKTLSQRVYLEIEEKVRKFSQRVRIPMAEIDLLFWSEETGQIFK
ncbi:MAG: N-glycosylase/DNA lyase [DPANN group archaeon]|nr:N-glycosylase/DNA lyase [DPANN group archaeon]